MSTRRKGLTLIAALLVVGVYLWLLRTTSLPQAPAITPEAPEARQPFPVDFALPDLQGQIMRLSYRRGQVVLVNFWATWCYPCRVEMPSMQALYQDYRDKGLEILAIAIDIQGKEVIAPFVETYGLTFPILLDPDNVVNMGLRVAGIPLSYLLDKRGRVAGVEIGARDWNSRPIRRLLDQLLAEPDTGSTP